MLVNIHTQNATLGYEFGKDVLFKNPNRQQLKIDSIISVSTIASKFIQSFLSNHFSGRVSS